MKINGAIITDCADANARARQEMRFASLFGGKPTFVGVGADVVLGEGNKASDIAAAGDLIDLINASHELPSASPDQKTVILMNVAPRGGKTRKQWDNGTPFCYFHVGNALVVSTYARRCLTLIRDMGLVDSVELLDVPTVTAEAVKWGELTENQADRMNHTQFRSFEFLPFVARWICDERPVPSEKVTLGNLPGIEPSVWCTDIFGNCKTTLLPRDIGFEEGGTVMIAGGHTAVCYKRLADVPRNETALVIGSSGFGDDRFLELVIQRGNAAKTYGLSLGSPVLESWQNVASKAKIKSTKKAPVAAAA